MTAAARRRRERGLPVPWQSMRISSFHYRSSSIGIVVSRSLWHRHCKSHAAQKPRSERGLLRALLSHHHSEATPPIKVTLLSCSTYAMLLSFQSDKYTDVAQG